MGVAGEVGVTNLAGAGETRLDVDTALAAAGLRKRVSAHILHGGPRQGQHGAALDQDSVQAVVADIGWPVTLDGDLPDGYRDAVGIDATGCGCADLHYRLRQLA